MFPVLWFAQRGIMLPVISYSVTRGIYNAILTLFPLLVEVQGVGTSATPQYPVNIGHHQDLDP